MNNISFKGITTSAEKAVANEYPVSPAKTVSVAKTMTDDAFILEDENQKEQKKQIDIDYSLENDYFITTRPKNSAKSESEVIAKNFKTIDDAVTFLKDTTIENCKTVQNKAAEDMNKIDNPRKKRAQYCALSGIVGNMNSKIKQINQNYQNWKIKTGQKTVD